MRKLPWTREMHSENPLDQALLDPMRSLYFLEGCVCYCCQSVGAPAAGPSFFGIFDALTSVEGFDAGFALAATLRLLFLSINRDPAAATSFLGRVHALRGFAKMGVV